MFIFAFLFLQINGSILKLTNTNFNKTLELQKTMMIYFHQENCAPCDSLKKEFQIASESSQIQFGEVYAQEEKELIKQLKINWFPLVVLLKDQKIEPYSGDRTAASLSNFAKKKVEGFVQEINHINQIKHKEYILLQTKNISLVKEYFNISESYFNLEFYIMKSNEEKIEFQIKEKIILPIKNNLKQLIVQNIKNFEFDSNSAQMLFENKIPGLLIFYEDDLQIFDEINEQFNNDILVFKIQKDSFWGEKLISNFKRQKNSKLDKLPQIMIIKTEENDIKKYYLNTDINLSSVRTFIDNFNLGELDDKLQSQNIIMNQQNNVYQMVGKEFESIVFDKKKTVVVLIFKDISEKQNDLYEQISLQYPDAQFTKIDAGLNKIPIGIQYKSLPFVFICQKSKNQIQSMKDGDFDNIDSFLKQNLQKQNTEL